MIKQINGVASSPEPLLVSFFIFFYFFYFFYLFFSESKVRHPMQIVSAGEISEKYFSMASAEKFNQPAKLQP